MKRQIITDVIYFELIDEMGPNPKAWLPTKISEINLLNISLKISTILAGEEGHVPESLVILPFISLNLKCLIKYSRWDDSSKRGGIGLSAIGLFFEEINDEIFYKYINQLSIPFNEISQKFVDLELIKAPRREYINLLNQLKTNIMNFLEELKLPEKLLIQGEQFPKQQIRDISLLDYKFKVIIVGDPSVGKTSLLLRYTNNAFGRFYAPTLGVKVSDKIFHKNDSIFQLTLWDIGGQQKFDRMRREFYRGFDALFLVCDLTHPDSFNNILKWYTDILDQIPKSSRSRISYIIGNKKDLVDFKVVTNKMLSDLANHLNLGFIETSALTGENVDFAFSTIANLLYKYQTQNRMEIS